MTAAAVLRRRAAALAVAAAVAGAAGCLAENDTSVPPDAIRVGTLLPFTGARAASGANLERALRLAMERVNAAGGIFGRPLALDVRDTHSDVALGLAAGTELLDQVHVPLLIGPEEPEIAYQMEAAVKSHDVLHVLPGLTSPYFYDPSGKAAWVRLAPPPEYLACVLVKRMLADGKTKIAAVLNKDDYSGTFSAAINRSVAAQGGTPLPAVRVSSDAGSFANTLLTVQGYSPDAIVLVAPPSVGAAVLTQWDILGLQGNWYFTPTLKDPEFVRNAPSRVLNGSYGVSPAVASDGNDFAANFLAQTGAEPRDASYFYYDAMALVALGLADAVAESGTMPDAVTLKTHMMKVASAPGEPVGYNDLGHALELITAGVDVEYRGAVGGYAFTDTGAPVENRGGVWQVEDQKFQQVGELDCLASEVGVGGQL